MPSRPLRHAAVYAAATGVVTGLVAAASDAVIAGVAAGTVSGLFYRHFLGELAAARDALEAATD